MSVSESQMLNMSRWLSLVSYTPPNRICTGRACCLQFPQHSAFWNFAFWSLSSFAFGRTWFPASTGGGGGESLYSPPSKGSKGFLNILNYVSKSSMNQNETDFIGNEKEIRALLHAIHLENPHWNIFPDTPRIGSAFQLPHSPLSNGLYRALSERRRS